MCYVSRLRFQLSIEQVSILYELFYQNFIKKEVRYYNLSGVFVLSIIFFMFICSPCWYVFFALNSFVFSLTFQKYQSVQFNCLSMLKYLSKRTRSPKECTKYIIKASQKALHCVEKLLLAVLIVRFPIEVSNFS